MDELITLIREPVKSIAKAKNRNMMRTYKLLLAEWIIMGLGFLIIPLAMGSTMAMIASTAVIATIIMGIVFTLFFGYLLTAAMRILGGKGDYYQGLTTLVYTIYPLAFGVLIASILSLIPIAGMILGFLVVSVLAVMSVATFFRATMDLFRVDAIRAFIACQVMFLGFFLAFYISLILGLAGAGALFGNVAFDAATLV